MLALRAGLMRQILSGPLSYFNQVLNDSPVGFWRFSETSGTVLTDYSGNNRHGTIFNSPYLGVDGYTSNTAAAFDGASQYCQVPYNAAFNVGAGEFVVEIIAKITNIGRGHTGGTNEYGLLFGIFDNPNPYNGPTIFANYSEAAGGFTAQGKITFRDNRNLSNSQETTASIYNDNKYRHYIFQRRKVSSSPDVWALETYVNGVLESSKTISTVSVPVESNPLYIAGRPGSVQNLGCSIDEVAFFVGKSFTAQKISDRFAALTVEKLINQYAAAVIEDAPVNYWRFDDGYSNNASPEIGTQIGTYYSVTKNQTGLEGSNNRTIKFTGSDSSYATFGTSIGNFGAGDFTFECLFRMDTDGHHPVIFSAGLFNNDGWYIQLGGGNGTTPKYLAGRVFPTSTPNVLIDSPPLINVGQTYHIAFVKIGGNARWYLNGLETTYTSYPTFPTTIVTNSRTRYLGRYDTTGFPLNGKVDEVAIYNKALAPARILEHARLAGLQSSQIVPTSWNSADIGSGMFLSNRDLTVRATSSLSNGVRSIRSVTSGKWYWEVRWDSGGPPSNGGPMIGISSSIPVMSGGGFAHHSRNNETVLYYPFNGGVFYGADPPYPKETWASGTVGDIFGIALDADASIVYFYKNNTLLGSRSYRPLLTGSNIFAFIAHDENSVEKYTTTRFSPAHQTYASPNGFTAGF